VKLLLDENLAPRLVLALADVYPGSQSVCECGLRGCSDLEVWQYALTNDFAIVLKDSDFSQRSFLQGSPPKVIWLRIGNCTTTRVDFVLRNAAPRIRDFLSKIEESCLVLTHPRS
jgi:predicted nuclease of predicted toxin-antitoxin system